MSAAARLNGAALVRLVGIAGTVVAAAALPTSRKFVAAQFANFSGILKVLAAVLALINLKNLPGLWHFRVFRGIFYQLWLQKQPLPPKHLFAPLVTQSYNTLYDSDYNIHKSNSTYFADLDVARAHHLSAIIRTSLARLNSGDREGLPAEEANAKGQYNIALGAVSCFFQRQIEVLQGFEIYTRVLSWDRKWLYVVSHIVKKGVIKPNSYVLQPWKNKKANKAAKQEEESLKKYIFATSLARYCFKRERLTINPEIVLERSRLIPPRPAGVGYPPRPADASIVGTPGTPTTPANQPITSPENIAGALNAKLDDVSKAVEEQEDWTWDDMERERLRGLRLASHFDAMSGLHDELRAGDVMGKFGDYW